MPAPALVAHLSTAELGQRYRAARQPIERSHLQIVWLLSQGRSEREVAAISGYGQRWIVERTFAWLGRCRRLAKDFENLAVNALAFLCLGMIRLMLRRPARSSAA